MICHWCHFKTLRLQSNREMLSGMPRAARRPTYLANSVNSVNLVLLDLLSSRRWFAPLGSEYSHFFKWLFTKMAVSMVSGRESEQELKESHLMLKNAWLCFSISSSFVGNNPSLQSHSFSEDRGKGNKTTWSNPSISYFSTMLASHILILADSSYLLSDEAYIQLLSLPCYRISTPCYEHKPNAGHFFDKIFKFFIKAWFCWEEKCLFCYMTSIGRLEIMIHHTPSIICDFHCPVDYRLNISFPLYLLLPASESSGDRLVPSY